MLAWVLHRLTGLGILLFVGAHVIAAFFMLGVGDNVSTQITIWYESTYVQIFVYFCVLYHALNGLRIVVMDLWPSLFRFQKEMVLLQIFIFLPVFGLPAALMVMKIVQGG